MPENLKKEFKDKNGKAYTITYNVPVFLEYQLPHGNLSPHPEAHALFYYYLLARNSYEKEQDPIVYEGDPDPTYNYKQLFTSVASLYDVRPEHMAKFWDEVDMQCIILKLPRLPNEERYRFSTPIVVETTESTDDD